MAGAGNIVFMWTLRACWIPAGTQQNNPPTAQSLAANNDFSANGGYVVVPGGANPTGANIDTAINTVATNAKAFFDNGAPLSVIQGWQNGTG